MYPVNILAYLSILIFGYLALHVFHMNHMHVAV
jgi:hypothetical protein